MAKKPPLKPKKNLEFLKSAAHLMLAYGGVALSQEVKNRYSQNTDVDYYGGNVKVDYQKSIDCCQLLTDFGIDYQNCTELEALRGMQFNGTFASESLYFQYLAMTIAFNDGSKYRYLVKIDDDHSVSVTRDAFSFVLKILLQVNISIDFILAKIEDRKQMVVHYGSDPRFSWHYCCILDFDDFDFSVSVK